MANKKRIDWIDTLRGLAMFFVIWGHCFPNIKGRVRKWIYSFHMPIFFFISGLTYKERDIEPRDFVKKKFKDLIVPYILFNIISYIVLIIFYKKGIIEDFDYLENIIGAFYSQNEALRMPCGPSWFLTTLFLVEVGFYYLKRITKDDFQLTISVIICGLISYVNSISHYQVYSPWHLESAFTGIVFYHMGYMLSKNMYRLDNFMEHKFKAFFTGGLLGLIGAIITVYNRRVSLNSNDYGSIILFYISCICTILGLIIFVRLFMKKSVVFKNVGTRTMFYIGYHRLLLFVLAYYFPIALKGNRNIFLLALYIMVVMFPFAYVADKFFPLLCGKIKKKM